MVSTKISIRISLCLLFGLCGFLGNWFKVPLFFNVDFLFGSFFSMLALMLLGRMPGIIAAFIAACCTYLLWNHPWAIIIFTGEAITVAWLYDKRKGNPVLYDLIYWICLGTPMIYLFYHLVMGIAVQATLVVMLKQSINGLTNTLLAHLALLAYKFAKKSTNHKIAYTELISVVMVAFALFPTMLLSMSAIRAYEEQDVAKLRAQVASTTQIVQKNLAGWVDDYHDHVQVLASFISDPNTKSFEKMQHYVETLKEATPALKGMGVFDNRSISVSYSPLEQDGKSNLGVDMSFRPHIATMRKDKKPYITDMLTSKLGDPSPIVILLAPIVTSGEYKGYCSGVVETAHLASYLTNLKTPDIDITLVDGQDRVIVSTFPDFKANAPFVRPFLHADKESSDYQPTLWLPEAKRNTSLMQRWRHSFLFTSVPVSENSRWRLIVEAPLLPVAEDISRYTLSWLGVQGLLISCAIALSFLLSQGFIANVRRLQVLTRSVPKRINDTAHIDWPQSTIQEIAELSANFEEMTSALANHIAEQKTIEEALRKSQATLETALSSMADSVLIVDRQGQFIHFNEAFVTFHRFSCKEECYTKIGEYPNIVTLFFDNGEHAPLDMWPVSRSLRGETATNAEYILQRKDTGETWVKSYSFSPIRGSDGVIVGSVVVGRDITKQKQAEEALRLREEEFRTLVENAPDVISLFDRDLRRIYVNSVVEENTGIDGSALRGKTLIEAGYPIKFTQPLNTTIEGVFATGIKAAVELDYEDHDERSWYEIRCAPVCDANGSVFRVMTIGRNITERKQTEIELNNSNQEKTALLKEVHHRVKNNLQIVASLLGLQAGRTDSPQALDVLKDTRGRVRSMALLHETLYRSGNLAQLNFASYLKDLCRQILTSSGPVANRVKLDFQIAAVELPLEPTLPCGLIVNELVSNALKYGFPGDRSGTISVILEAIQDHSFALSVRDDGVGMPADFNPTSTSTLGMRLVTGLVAQIGGQLRVETPREGGVLFYAVFPFPVNTKIGDKV